MGSKMTCKNPMGREYLIYVTSSDNGKVGSDILTWEGYGEDNPWAMFYEVIDKYRTKYVTIYVDENSKLKRLAQYRGDNHIYYY